MHPTIELDPDHYQKLTIISKATKLPLAQILIALLEITDEVAFEERLRQLERDAKLLLADCREHNTRMSAIAQMMTTDFALQRD